MLQVKSICLMSARSLTNSVLKDSWCRLFENVSLYNKSRGSDTLWWGSLYRLMPRGSVCSTWLSVRGEWQVLKAKRTVQLQASGADLSTFIFFTLRKYVLRSVNSPGLANLKFLLHFCKRRHQVTKDARSGSSWALPLLGLRGWGIWILSSLVHSFPPLWGAVDLHRECIPCKMRRVVLAVGCDGYSKNGYLPQPWGVSWWGIRHLKVTYFFKKNCLTSSLQNL